jgi:MgsA AAA+ ATPase C terminal
MLIWVGVSALKIEQYPANQLYIHLQYHTLIVGLMFFRPSQAQGGADMNGPEILHLIRHDLQGAVARQGKPPTPRPMDASPWVAMSAIQKAIRRGCEDLALGAAATLLRDAPHKLWRRIGCIAFEDIGVASLEAVGLATVALAGKRHRAALGGEWAVASCVVVEMCRAPKCRAADDLLMACELHPAYAQARAELLHLTTHDLIILATGNGSIHERALALWYALGTDRDRSTLVSRRGDPRVVFDQLCEAGWPHTIVEVAREGFRRTRIMLCPLVALLACETCQDTQLESDILPPEEMIGGVPTWAIDLYSREGRAALARFLQTDAPAARWIRRNIRPAQRLSFLGHIIFRVEGGLVANRMRWPLDEELRRQVDVECSGPECPDATEILELMQGDIARLNEARVAVMGAPRG